ncbi:unnamed protein product [Rotaria sordida]|uniref:Uncharacterized protein n=1 Tax=Rotaria sordida TaxID=392033 RepID=A0A814S1J2_9BILA|nr:unnamed protein product [Rotaria sordida]
MQHAVAISGEEDDQTHQRAKSSNIESNIVHPLTSEPMKLALSYSWSSIKYLFHLLHPSTIHNTYNQLRQMTFKDIIKNLYLLLIKCMHLLLMIIIFGFRTLTYCIWNLMAEDDQQNVQRQEQTSSPPPLAHRYSYRLPSISIPHGSENGEDILGISAFGIGVSLDSEEKPRMSLTDEQISLLLMDSTRIMESRRTSSSISGIGLSTGQSLLSSMTSTYTPLSPSTTSNRNQPVITPSGPNEVNTQIEYQQKRSSPNINGTVGEDDDVTPSEPPTRTDFGKKALALMARNYHTLKFMALCLAFIINFLMLFYKAMPLTTTVSESDSSDDTEQFDEDDNEIIVMDPRKYYMMYLLRAAAFLHSSVAFLMMISYYKLKVPLVIFKREKEIARKLEFEGAWLIDQPSENNSWILSYLSREWHKLVISSKSFPDSYWDKFVKKKVRNKYSDQFDYDELSRFLGMEKNDTPGKFEIIKPIETGLWAKIKSIDMRYLIWKWGVIFTDNSFLYVFFYFLFSIIGNFAFFVFAIHLLDIAISVKALSTILKSITHNGRQLLLTIMLMAVVVYLYTVIAFNFFRKFYTKEEDEEREENCKDMLTCFKFHLYSGIRAGGGIGDELESPNGDPLELYRIIFDITFFFFIIVILLAIIQGLIIDAFGDLREQLDSVKETLESKCFICGIGQDYFDKEPHGFETHTQAEHNFANYMFFLTHLLNKPDTEHTGQESYVWEMYQSRKWDFFPIGDCFRRQYESGSTGTTTTTTSSTTTEG